MLEFHGRGHTDHDITVRISDAPVIFVGDLIEQGAPPSFEDSFPLEWADTIAAIPFPAGGIVVPGHGDLVDQNFVAEQKNQLEQLAIAAGQANGDIDAVVTRVPFPESAARVALARAVSQLPN